MSATLEPLDRLTHQLSRLPGVGPKTAQRLAYFILELPKDDVVRMADSLVDARELIHSCSRCGHYAVDELCAFCSDPHRNSQILCVVRDPRDVFAIEKTHEFRGRYHVLHGVLSPMDGIGPDDIRFAELMQRIPEEDVQELVLATNPDVEGEATASYISSRAKEAFPSLRITRLAYGVPIGSDLEYVDELTLQRAFDGRREI